MIFPVGINHVIRGLPWLTLTIIAICTCVHIYAAHVAPSPEEIRTQIEQRIFELDTLGDDPQAAERLAREAEDLANQLPYVRYGYRTDSGLSWRLITSAFLHADWLHLIGNMLFLWLAGAALEDRWGRARFALFYVVGAAGSALFFSALHTGDETTLIGASGAVSALMGAFLVCFARMQIHFVYWFGIAVGRFDAAAYLALPLWLGEQLLGAAVASSAPGVSSVAFTAHIGGFLFGLAVALVAWWIKQPRVQRTSVPAARALAPQAHARPSAANLKPATPSAELPPRIDQSQPRVAAPQQPLEPPNRVAPAKPVEPPKPAPHAGEGPRFLV